MSSAQDTLERRLKLVGPALLVSEGLPALLGSIAPYLRSRPPQIDCGRVSHGGPDNGHCLKKLQYVQ